MKNSPHNPFVLFHSRTLAALRDALLPKLLSGEIRVQREVKSGKDTAHA